MSKMKITGGFRQDETFKRHVNTKKKGRAREINYQGEREGRRKTIGRGSCQTGHGGRKVGCRQKEEFHKSYRELLSIYMSL